nr:MAG TPA: ER membrane protein complex subunit 1, C-terminal [Caudoviricetes sp.]
MIMPPKTFDMTSFDAALVSFLIFCFFVAICITLLLTNFVVCKGK